jgi:sulfite exporter TauE/SafE
MVEAVLLAISTGPYCLVSCAPVTLPFLFAENMNGRENAQYVGLFLLGRMIGYLLFAVLLWIVGRVLLSSFSSTGGQVARTIIYLLLGLLMIVSGVLYTLPGLKMCAIAGLNKRAREKALLFGLLTGLNLCPPFLTAAARVLEQANLVWGIGFFLLFFATTSVFFLPFFGVFWIQKHMAQIRMISRIALVLVGTFYSLVYGLLPLIRIVT